MKAVLFWKLVKGPLLVFTAFTLLVVANSFCSCYAAENLEPEIMSFEEAIQAVSMHNYSMLEISFNRFGTATHPFVQESWGWTGYLTWLAPNGTIYEAEYPSGRAIVEIMHTIGSDSEWNPPEGYYIWILTNAKGDEYWVNAKNGLILMALPRRGEFPLQPQPISAGIAIMISVAIIGTVYYILKKRKQRFPN